jgi:two-component system, NtrC family, response regulator AtoC
MQLLAERFLACGRSWIDLASGAAVRIRLAAVGGTSEQIAWSDRCAELSRLRHPVINTLLDYGCAGSGRVFEAYSIAGPIGATGSSGSVMLTHGVRFLESRGLPLTRETASAALREVAIGGRQVGRRVLGILLQPRRVLQNLIEAFEDASPGGIATIDISGPRGSGVRTVRTLAARAARLNGYVPVSAAVLVRHPGIADQLLERHVCVLVDEADEQSVAATFLTRLGTASGRRQLLLRFNRGSSCSSTALQMDPLGVTAMSAMVFIDRDYGPPCEDVLEAARDAAGRPGAFLERLRAASFEDRRVRVALVHETSPEYVVEPRVEAPGPRRRPGAGRALNDAPERAIRLAERGRHASAIRLLSRASRVLEGRGERAPAAACAVRHGWIARERGRSTLAVEQFERARALSSDGLLGIQSAIGLGVVWTDEERFIEAEGALRGAAAAADLLNDHSIKRWAVRALARCLHCQLRHDEAMVTLAPALMVMDNRAHTRAADDRAEEIAAWALAARIRLATGDLRGAVVAAGEALQRAERTGSCRATATASRSMAMVQSALGDGRHLRQFVEQGLAAAAAGHLPLVGLCLRAVLLTTPASLNTTSECARLAGRLRAALKHRVLPRLLYRYLERACDAVHTNAALTVTVNGHDEALTDLRHFLELAHGAADDHQAIEQVCRALGERLRAASVQVVGGPPERAVLVRAGRPWQADLRSLDRLFAGGTAAGAEGVGGPRPLFEPVRYGQELVAVLCCRWTTGVPFDGSAAAAMLRAAALAMAAPVRGLLDRPRANVPEAAWGDLIGASPSAASLRDAIARAARAPFPVLIEGESGSGKELVSRAIHRLSARRDRRLCTVNCAALSEDLLEAELFGHARGAFTGAVGERAGLFEEADGGTLFLDEVGELSPRAQAKLLRVLQDGEVRRVGENLPRRVDARIVAATNRRLDEEASAGRFRSDLRFRLDVVRIAVPPLRDRATDIPALAAHFWTEAAARVGSSATLTAETVAALARYDWPGNVRELQNVVASLAVHAPRRGRILPAMLPAHVARSSMASATSFEAARYDFERRFVRAALAQAGGQRTRAARALGVSRQGLAKMLNRLGIEG